MSGAPLPSAGRSWPDDVDTFDDPDRLGSADEARIAGTLGLVSAISLAASFVWVHHWGPMTVTIIGVWVLSTLGALILGVRNLRPRSPGRKLAALALCCVALSALAVLTSGVAYAAGMNPPISCGGG